MADQRSSQSETVPSHEERVAQAIQRAYEEGYANGRAQGYNDGRRDGYQDGIRTASERLRP